MKISKRTSEIQFWVPRKWNYKVSDTNSSEQKCKLQPPVINHHNDQRHRQTLMTVANSKNQDTKIKPHSSTLNWNSYLEFPVKSDAEYTLKLKFSKWKGKYRMQERKIFTIFVDKNGTLNPRSWSHTLLSVCSSPSQNIVAHIETNKINY